MTLHEIVTSYGEQTSGFDLVAEWANFYNGDGLVEKSHKGDVWINFTHLIHKIDMLKSKSKLNVTKYRRNGTTK